MVASRTLFRLPELQFDRATAFGLALAGNALMLMLLSLPRDDGEVALPFVAEPDPPPIFEVSTRAEATAHAPAIEQLRVPRPTPQPVLRTVIEQPTSTLIQHTEAVPSDRAAPADAVEGEPPAGPAPGPAMLSERGASIAYDSAPPPPYPRQALRRGLEGTVELRVLVGVDGRPKDVQIAVSSGHRELDNVAARQVLERWSFVPAQRDGREVEGWARVPVQFKLQRH